MTEILDDSYLLGSHRGILRFASDTSDLDGNAVPPPGGAFACAKEILVFEPGVLTTAMVRKKERQPYGCLSFWWTIGGSNP